MDDLSPELRTSGTDNAAINDWEVALKRWADHKLAQGDSTLLDNALPRFEQILIESALAHTGGRRQDAAKLLGWGRNTLTRKIKELGMEADKEQDVMV